MSRIWLGVLLISFGTFFLLDSMELIKSNFYLDYLNLVRKYWPGMLILLGIRMIVKEKNPGLADALKWLLILLIGLWIFATFFMQRNWII